MTFRDPAFRERTLIAELDMGNGIVSGEFWHVLTRVIIDDDAALADLERVGRAWRVARGMPNEDFIVGVGE